jgi:hypothetical protein
MPDYVKPFWRRGVSEGGLSPRDYVRALLNPDNADSDLAAQVEIFLNLSMEGRPEFFTTPDVRLIRRTYIIDDLITSIERGRKLHHQISREEIQLSKAMWFYNRLRETEEWIYEEFNHTPEHPDTIPDDLGDLIVALGVAPNNDHGIELALPLPDLNQIEPRIVKPVFRYIRERINNRIKIAKNRVALAGGTRNLGTDEPGQDAAGLRTAMGEMALEMMQHVGWDPAKPTIFQLTSLTEFAEELFGMEGKIKTAQVRHALATALENWQNRYQSEDEEGWSSED